MSRRIGRMAAFLARRPRHVIVAWIVVVGMLGVIGHGLDKKLDSQLPYIGGSQAKRAQEIVEREFGGDYALVVLLRGPRVDVERQGKVLVDRFNNTPKLHAVSPWAASGAGVKGLTPAPGVAAIVVRVESPRGKRIDDFEAPIQRQLRRVVAAPVRSSLAGLPVIGDSYRRASADASKLGQLIGIPILLLVLLFVFRSALAAILPVVVGGAVVTATRGVLSLLANVITIDLFSIGVAGMMGLALGVDYSLLVVSRFREERRHRDMADAVQVTVQATARSIVPAGSGLILAMLVSMLVIPAGIVNSIAITVIVVTLLSVISAMCVTPALLVRLGPRLERWSLPTRRPPGTLSLRWSRRLAGNRRAVISIIVGMVFCSLLAFTLNTAVISFELLPSDDPGRRQQEDVERALGPGWIAPMEVVVNGRDGPLTSPSRLRALAAFQRRAERDPGVTAVAGFSKVASSTAQLTSVEGDIEDQERGLDRLGKGISRLHAGAAAGSSGLLQAAAGARALDSGLGAADGGAGLLANGLRAVGTGSGRLADGLSQADDGSGKLAEGTTKASSGASRIADALARAKEGIGEVQGAARLLETAMQSGKERLAELHAPLRDTGSQLDTAWRALQRMTTGRGDAEYATVLLAVEEANRRLTGIDIRTGEQPDPAYGGVEKGIERAEGQFDVGQYLSSKLNDNGGKAVDGMRKLASGSARLDHGLHRLAAGSRQLSAGIARLSQGGEQLSPAMEQLGEGAERLAGGLGQLKGGAGQLAGGLGGGAQKSKLLSGALHKIGTALDRQGGGEGGGSQLDQLREKSPGLFRSGYFVLAGLDGSKPKQRDQLGALINLERGGLAARMLVIPRAQPSSVETLETKERLEHEVSGLARETDTEVVVGGVGPNSIEINKALRDSSPILRIALALVTFVVLLLVLRSLLIPIIAALLNVITVGATFGLLAVLFNNSLLGGPGFVEGTVVPGAVMVIFGLAIDYEVFVFARIREEYLRTGSSSAAIANGLEHTAPVVSGAALIMIGVFLSFSVSDFMVIRDFGVAQAIAIFLDAFIVRLVVIPAVMGWLGKWSWWMPGWLDRLLPGGTPIAARSGEGELAPAAESG